jgi:hypothetical protein
MANEIDINAVIEQLVGRIAQLEFEVAVLKAQKFALEPHIAEGQDPETPGGYM